MPPIDWQSDWLYSLILREADKAWVESRSVPVLIEEYSSVNEAIICAGDVVRAWVRDQGGMRQIDRTEHEVHKRTLKSTDAIYPFVLFHFHIHPDRRHVAIGQIHGGLAGSGAGFLVEGTEQEATLTPDPDAGMWVA